MFTNCRFWLILPIETCFSFAYLPLTVLMLLSPYLGWRLRLLAAALVLLGLVVTSLPGSSGCSAIGHHSSSCMATAPSTTYFERPRLQLSVARKRKRANFNTVLLLLLLSGDIAQNPGPRSCSMCKREFHGCSIPYPCATCSQLAHYGCTNLTLIERRRNDVWYCGPGCVECESTVCRLFTAVI